ESWDTIELRSDLARHLDRTAFPATRERLLEILAAHQAEQRLLDLVSPLPEDATFANPGEGLRALGMPVEERPDWPARTQRRRDRHGGPGGPGPGGPGPASASGGARRHRERAAEELDEPLHDRGRVDDVAAVSLRLELGSLFGLEVAGVLVHVDPGAQAVPVQLGVELGGIDGGADPQRLHRARRGTGQQDGVVRQPAERLLVADERRERGRQATQQRVPPAFAGERDL